MRIFPYVMALWLAGCASTSKYRQYESLPERASRVLGNGTPVEYLYNEHLKPVYATSQEGKKILGDADNILIGNFSVRRIGKGYAVRRTNEPFVIACVYPEGFLSGVDTDSDHVITGQEAGEFLRAVCEASCDE